MEVLITSMGSVAPPQTLCVVPLLSTWIGVLKSRIQGSVTYGISTGFIVLVTTIDKSSVLPALHPGFGREPVY